MQFPEAISVVLASPVLGVESVTRICALNKDCKQRVHALFESKGMQYSEALDSLRLYNAQLRSRPDALPAVYLLVHAKEIVRESILAKFSLRRVQEHIARGEMKAVTSQAFDNSDEAKAFKQALDRCHVSCFTPVGIFCMLYEISKVLDHLAGNENIDVSLAQGLVAKRGSLVFVNSPNVQGLVTNTATVGVAPFPSNWLEDSRAPSGRILRSLPRWFIEDPRLVYLFALEKFQTELEMLVDELKPPVGRLTNFATTDLSLAILSSPIGLALYRDTDRITLLELYALGTVPGALPGIRKLVFSFPGLVLVRTAGPAVFADVVLRSPTGLNAYLASGDFPTGAKGLAHVMRYQRDGKPVIEADGIHPRFVRSLILAADKIKDLNDEHLLATCAQLGIWSAGSATTHAWLPHDLIVEGLLRAAAATEPTGASHVPELLRALDAYRPASVDDRGARAIMGSVLLQDPLCEASAVTFVKSASVVAVALVAFVADDKIAAIEAATKDAKAYIFQTCTEHAEKIEEQLAAEDTLLTKIAIHPIDAFTGTADNNAPGILVSKLLRVVSSEDGRRLQNDGVLDVSSSRQIMEVTAFLANPVLAQGLTEKVWDADFLVKLRIAPTDLLLDGLKKKLMPKADVLALPRTIFGTFDTLHSAISSGFLVTQGDSYDAMLAQLARYHEDEMSDEQIARAREKSGENDTIVKLKLLFSHYEYESVEAAFAWEQLSKLGATYHDCATMPLPCFLLLLDDDVSSLLEGNDAQSFQHVAKLPVQFAQLLVDDEEARTIIQKPWFTLDRCASWSRAQVESVMHLSKRQFTSFLNAVLPAFGTLEELISLTVPTLDMLRKKENLNLITKGQLKLSELVSVGSNADVHLNDVLSICFTSGLIQRAVKADDWPSLLAQLRDPDVQALLRRNAELFETELLYQDDAGDWRAADLPYLARLKDSDMHTYNTTFQLLSNGHIDRDAFRDIVSLSPSWLGQGSEAMYELGVLNAKLIQGFHAKAPQLHSMVGYLNFQGLAVTYNELMKDADDDFTFELFLQPEFSPEIIQHLLLGRFATPLRTQFLSHEYFVHPDKSPLIATGRLMAKLRPPKDQMLMQNLAQRGVRAGHIREYNGQDALEEALPLWQGMAASDPLDANFLKSAAQLAAAKATEAAKAIPPKPDNPFAAAVAKAAEAKSSATSDNPFLAGVAKASAGAKPVAASSVDDKPASKEAEPAPAASKFTFQLGAGQPTGTTFTFKSQASGGQNFAAAAQRRRNASAAKDA